ncbi:DinB superfamily protein [Paenibacillus konkukensis]|uniref:DinB superfamily protein n=1 Tax=Paenibacillus konkukensis TaxID=2020716 RepID=A0ABY4RKE5_9BACL|nr:DinB family protein [Paenibacillus konkukensis]UQZ82300.1 DinB superfamily protein [Paenibacillus konkukensis]
MSYNQQVIDLAAYTDTYRQLKEAIAGLSEEQLKYKPAPDKWSVTEVLSHLADHSIVFSFRVRKIISEDNAQLAAFQQDPWVSRSRANKGSASDILDAFGALLAYNKLLFQRLSAEDWARSGANFKGETVTLESSLLAFIRHVQTHLGQIERIKSALA